MQWRTVNQNIARVVQRFSQLAEVKAIALGGSQATGQVGANSDYDIYIYVRENISAGKRLEFGLEFSPNAQIVDYWGPGLEWDDPESNIHIDTIYFETSWIEAQLNKTLVQCEASLGYSTCFWHTVRVSQILYDPDQWFARLQQQAQVPYPDLLAQRIIALNLPVLRDSFSSYRRQIAKAVQRHDAVDLQHKVSSYLASVFDILFAVNRIPHPGEKRLIDLTERQCALLPPNLRQKIEAILADIINNPPAVVSAVDALTSAIVTLLSHANVSRRSI